MPHNADSAKVSPWSPPTPLLPPTPRHTHTLCFRNALRNLWTNTAAKTHLRQHTPSLSAISTQLWPWCSITSWLKRVSSGVSHFLQYFKKMKYTPINGREHSLLITSLALSHLTLRYSTTVVVRLLWWKINKDTWIRDVSSRTHVFQDIQRRSLGETKKHCWHVGLH